MLLVSYIPRMRYISDILALGAAFSVYNSYINSMQRVQPLSLSLTFKLLLSPKTYKAAGSQPCVIIALSIVSMAEMRFKSFSLARRSIVADDMFTFVARDCCFAVALLFDTGVAETIYMMKQSDLSVQ